MGGPDQRIGQFPGTPLISFEAAKEAMVGIQDDGAEIMGHRPAHLSHVQVELRGNFRQTVGGESRENPTIGIVSTIQAGVPGKNFGSIKFRVKGQR